MSYDSWSEHNDLLLRSITRRVRAMSPWLRINALLKRRAGSLTTGQLTRLFRLAVDILPARSGDPSGNQFNVSAMELRPFKEQPNVHS